MDVILTTIVGTLASIVSSVVTWFITRRKYNSEVDKNVILNMKESLDFYKKLSDDNKARLEEVLHRNRQLEEEVKELRKQVLNLTTVVCTDLSAQLRRNDLKLTNTNEEESI